jgi:AcrR family transcriptional regulator
MKRASSREPSPKSAVKNAVTDLKNAPSDAIIKKLEPAVLETFSEGDFHQADMRTIAKKAGVSFDTIYKYYGSKEQMLFSFVDKWLGELTDQIIDHLQGVDDTKEKIRKMFWAQLDFYDKHPRIPTIIYTTIPYKTWAHDESFRQRRLIKIILEALQEGQDNGTVNPKVRTDLLLDIMFGVVLRTFLMWNYRGRKEKLTALSGVLFEMLWRAISNPDQAGGQE